MKLKSKILSLSAALVMVSGIDYKLEACTRVMYEGKNAHIYTARSLDWAEDMYSDIWVFPRGMKKDGGIDKNSIKWVSKYGSVIVSGYDAGTVDALNEKGLFTNILYLAEADYGKSNKPTLSVGAWAQYVVDNFATVKEAVETLKKEPFKMVAPVLPNGKEAALHLSISDPSGDSAIFEYVKGKLVIHHSKKYKVMTNSPLFEQQLALNTYWKEIGGGTFLPGTSRAADRYVRASYYTDNIPKYEGKKAIATVFGIIRSVSVPLGIADPKKPNISPTRWRVVADQDLKHLKLYYESALSPNVIWVDLNKIDFSKNTKPRYINLEGHPALVGDVSNQFVGNKPFQWLAPAKKR